ncbi:unnamed protein product [Paramecium sonneborni]|uniref:Uncharacterized protein n=1 Tax=Paramecium sonneborni TaxID=65129 RepID=A0A8S1JVL8_9CILI|nr:unnamed protein product [Paramecium sonneborni]
MYENQEEPELTSTYNKNQKLVDIIIKLRSDFLKNPPYCQNLLQKDRAKIELEQKILKYTEKIEDDWRNIKELGNKLNQEYQQSQDQRAKLKQLRSFISEANESLEKEIKRMEKFQNDHYHQEVNEDNILKILSLNQADEQICNLQANLSGFRDTYRYVQNRISTNRNVSLEWVCSIVKQLAEQEFNDIQLLKKCQRQLVKN